MIDIEIPVDMTRTEAWSEIERMITLFDQVHFTFAWIDDNMLVDCGNRRDWFVGWLAENDIAWEFDRTSPTDVTIYTGKRDCWGLKYEPPVGPPPF